MARSEKFQAQFQDLVDFLAHQKSNSEGNEFFEALVLKLAELTETEFAFIGRPVDDTYIETVALSAGGTVTENIRYEIAGTPCENVIGKENCCYPTNVQETFPADHLLAEMEIDSYLGVPLWDSNGNPHGHVAVMSTRPIENISLIESLIEVSSIRASSELQRMTWESELAASETRFRVSFENAGIGMTITNLDGTFSAVNPAFSRMIGYAEEELLGKPVLDFTHPDDKEASFADRDKVLTHKSDPAAVEKRYIRKNGSITWGLLTRSVVRNEAGEPNYIIGQIQDITDRKKAEQQLARSNEVLQIEVEARTEELRTALNLAESASQAKTNFLANMSHELRTPLNAIIGFSEALTEKTFGPLNNEKQEEYIHNIHESGEHLLDLISDVLDVSAIEAEKLELVETVIDVGELISASLAMVSSQSESGAIRITHERESTLPTLKADLRRMRQILVNLISNAVKFTEPGGVVTVGASLDYNGSLTITVSDTGIGISAENIEVALQPFERITLDDGHQTEGTGLGLPLAKRLTEAQGGALEIESIPGSGTTVAVRFPSKCLS